MSQKPIIAESSIDIAASTADVWKLLTKPETIKKITGLDVRSDIADNSGSGNGAIVIGGGAFFARYSPYDIELDGTQVKIRIRAASTPLGCRVAALAAVREGAAVRVTSERLRDILIKLKSSAETGKSDLSDGAKDAKSRRSEREAAIRRLQGLGETPPDGRDAASRVAAPSKTGQPPITRSIPEETTISEKTTAPEGATVPEGTAAPAKEATPSANRTAPEEGNLTAAVKPSANRTAPEEGKLTAAVRPPPINRFAPLPELSPKEQPKRIRHGLRASIILLLTLVLLSLCSLVYFRFTRLENHTDMSERVSFDGAKNIHLGMTGSRIAFELGTNGIPAENNGVIYRAVTAHDSKLPPELIFVEFSAGGRARMISCLDSSAATAIVGIKEFNAEISADMSVEEVVEAVGLPFSLYRRYNTDDGEMFEEVHFGYLDPTANFNPAWRGEFEVILNRTQGVVSIKNWGWYDGSDPTMRGSIDNTPFANQYDSYTDFLNDRFHLSRSVLLLNGYSLGDTKYFFDGEPVHYSNDFGYQFHCVDSKEKLPGSDIPLYRIAIGYDNKGIFQMASFSNMRLYNKTGMLADSDYRGITRGMSYSEVRSLMQLVPTAVHIDEDFLSLCYGRFLNTDVADEQFEVIIRFDHEKRISQKVLINTAVSDAKNAGDG